MDAHSQQYFEVMDSLSQHPGWKLLRDDLIGFQEAIASGWAGLTVDNFRYEQGRFAGLKQASDHFNSLETIKAAILGDEADALTDPANV